MQLARVTSKRPFTLSNNATAITTVMVMSRQDYFACTRIITSRLVCLVARQSIYLARLPAPLHHEAPHETLTIPSTCHLLSLPNLHPNISTRIHRHFYYSIRSTRLFPSFYPTTNALLLNCGPHFGPSGRRFYRVPRGYYDPAV